MDVSAINVHNIDYITVLQAPSASALFGSEGSAGAIVISSKKARRPYYSYYPKWTDYTLENEEDESYITEIRNCEIADIMDVYTELENANKGHAIFYFDMAECFFERQLKDKALEILLEGVETCKDSPAALKGAAFIFESWKEFNEAIKIYKDILENSPHDMITKRDLALAYYQNGQYQLAVDTYYQVISSHDETDYNKNEGIQVTAMNEMNAVISMFGSCLNLGSMNLNLVKLLPVDIRITAESNYSYLNNFRITDPLGKEFNYQHQYAIKSWNYNREYRGYYTAINDHSIKNAIHGSYKIKIDSYNNYNGYIPIYIRLVVFKNFQKKDQTLEVKHFALNGQYGAVEVASIKW